MCCSNLICETFLIQDGVGVSKKIHRLKHLISAVLQGKECSYFIKQFNSWVKTCHSFLISE